MIFGTDYGSCALHLLGGGERQVTSVYSLLLTLVYSLLSVPGEDQDFLHLEIRIPIPACPYEEVPFADHMLHVQPGSISDASSSIHLKFWHTELLGALCEWWLHGVVGHHHHPEGNKDTISIMSLLWIELEFRIFEFFIIMMSEVLDNQSCCILNCIFSPDMIAHKPTFDIMHAS